MKKLFIAMLVLLTACGSPRMPLAPTAIMNQYPTLLPTPTLAVLARPIEDNEKEEALNFFYELKIQMASGEYEHFAEAIRYPITVNVDGQPKTFVFAAELEADFKRIFSGASIQKFISTDESELVFTPDGVKVADGIIWFNLICLDASCGNAEYLITAVNN
jgi:hypothetical protein